MNVKIAGVHCHVMDNAPRYGLQPGQYHKKYRRVVVRHAKGSHV
jgi:hypothetical protein